MLAFLEGRLTIGVEAVVEGRYHRSFEWRGESGYLDVSLDEPFSALLVNVSGAAAAHAEQLIVPLRQLFDLDADPELIVGHFSADPWLGPLIGEAPGIRVPGAWSTYELIVRAIVGQQC